MLTTLHMVPALGLNFGTSSFAVPAPVLQSQLQLVDTEAETDSETVADPDEVWRVDNTLSEGDDEDSESLRIDFRNCGECREDREAELQLELAAIRAMGPTDPEAHALEERRKKYAWENVYLMMGGAPATSLNSDSIHPHLRYDMELGLAFWRPVDDRTLTLGIDGHISQFFDRKQAGGGADLVGSAQVGHFYARAGLGVLTGIPYGPQSDEYRPAVGGVVGMGATVTDGDFGGRVGLDYDVRIDRGRGIVQTVLLSARFSWGF